MERLLSKYTATSVESLSKQVWMENIYLPEAALE
jgi:hypothetical protein